MAVGWSPARQEEAAARMHGHVWGVALGRDVRRSVAARHRPDRTAYGRTALPGRRIFGFGPVLSRGSPRSAAG